MGTYQKYAKKIDETKYQLRILKDWIQEAKATNNKDVVGVANLMEAKLKILFEIYETK